MKRYCGKALLFVIWSLLALFVFWQYNPVQRKLDADASFMLYAGQQILRGHAPYASVGIVKLPLSPLVAAAGIAAGRVLALDDILGGRLGFWLCAGASVGMVYLIGAGVVSQRKCQTSHVKRHLYGSLGAAILLGSHALGIQVAEGPEAKLLLILAGMLSVWLIAQRRWFWAGAMGVLAFLTWQPGLIFVATALLAPIVEPREKRQGAWARALAGTIAPLLIVAAYLAVNDALDAMWRQAFAANMLYLTEKKVSVGLGGIVAANAVKVWNVALECSGAEAPLMALGLVGMLGSAVALFWRVWRTRDAHDFLKAFPLVLTGATLLAFTLLDLQKCSDLVVLLPYLALGAGGAIYLLVLGIAHATARTWNGNPVRFTNVFGAFTVGVILLWGAQDAFAVPPQTGLAHQRALAQEIAAQLAPTDRMQQFGDAVFLVILRRENATRYIHLGEKQGRGILLAEEMTIDALIQQLRAANPRLITLSRAKTKDWAAPLYEWIAQNYVLQTSYGASEGGTLKETDVWWRNTPPQDGIPESDKGQTQ